MTTVPVTLRSLAPAGRTSFTGVLTGGNGRAVNTGQTNYYQVDVPAGRPELNATVTLADNPNNQMYAWLVDPAGNAEAFTSNILVTTDQNGNPEFTNTLGANLHVLSPAAGMWALIVVFAPQVSGMAISEPFTVDMNENAVRARAPGLPDSTTKTLTGTATVNVTVHNDGTAPEAYFVDARLSTSVQYNLAVAGWLGHDRPAEAEREHTLLRGADGDDFAQRGCGDIGHRADPVRHEHVQRRPRHRLDGRPYCHGHLLCQPGHPGPCGTSRPRRSARSGPQGPRPKPSTRPWPQRHWNSTQR